MDSDEIAAQKQRSMSQLLVVPHGSWYHLRGRTAPFIRASGGNTAVLPEVGYVETQVKKKRVAIVEDEPDVLTTYMMFLERNGYGSAVAFVTGEQFVQSVADGKVSPELVIMDYRLPGIDGLEAAKQAERLKPEMKVIITTADDSIEHRAATLGFSFLQKPFSLRQLLQVIESS
jgi:CheY-like chemotaxis protein